MSSDKNEIRNKEGEAILKSVQEGKNVVIVAGPGTGKTHNFKLILEKDKNPGRENIVMTFINPLVDDLNEELSHLATVKTFDKFIKDLCESKLSLLKDHKYRLGLNGIISEDHFLISDAELKSKPFKESQRFIDNLLLDINIDEKIENFLQERNDFYRSIDSTTLKYKLLKHLENTKLDEKYNIIIIDEFQDFNKLEAEIIIKHLTKVGKLVLAGDDDQVLFSFKGSNPDSIRELFNEKNEEFDSKTLSYCSRCPYGVVEFANKVIKYGKDKSVFCASRCDKDFIPFNEKESESVKKIEIEEGKYFKIEEILKEIEDKKAKVLILFPFQAGKSTALKLYKYLTGRGFEISLDKKDDFGIIFEALDTLIEDPDSNYGWRLIIGWLYKDKKEENKNKLRLREIIRYSYKYNKSIKQSLSDKDPEKITLVKNAILAFQKIKTTKIKNDGELVGNQDALLELLNNPLGKVSKTEYREGKIKDIKKKYFKSKLNNSLEIKMCSISKSKGLAADYVFIFPYLSKYLNKNEEEGLFNILVAITRARKKLFLVTPQENKQHKQYDSPRKKLEK